MFPGMTPWTLAFFSSRVKKHPSVFAPDKTGGETDGGCVVMKRLGSQLAVAWAVGSVGFCSGLKSVRQIFHIYCDIWVVKDDFLDQQVAKQRVVKMRRNTWRKRCWYHLFTHTLFFSPCDALKLHYLRCCLCAFTRFLFASKKQREEILCQVGSHGLQVES